LELSVIALGCRLAVYVLQENTPMKGVSSACSAWLENFQAPTSYPHARTAPLEPLAMIQHSLCALHVMQGDTLLMAVWIARYVLVESFQAAVSLRVRHALLAHLVIHLACLYARYVQQEHTHRRLACRAPRVGLVSSLDLSNSLCARPALLEHFLAPMAYPRAVYVAQGSTHWMAATCVSAACLVSSLA